MNKFLASAVVFLILFSSVSPALAQKSRTSKGLAATPRALETSARAISDGNGVWIEWETDILSSERAYQIHRLDLNAAKPINGSPIPRKTGVQGYFDRSGTLGSVYTLEAIDLTGARGRSIQVPVDYVPNLSAETGGRSAAMMGGAPAGVYTSYQFNITPDVAVGIEPGLRPTNPIIQRMVAAQGGVKLGIKKDGFYRVTRAQLATGGFNVNTDHNNWRLFLDGIEQAIIVEPSGNHIEFFVKAKEVIETDTRYLYLINGSTAGRRIATRNPSDTGNQTVATGYDQYFTLRQRTNYINDIINGEADNFWGTILSNLPTQINFNLSGIDTTSPNAVATLKFHGFVGNNQSVTVTLNSQNLGTFVGVARNPFGGQVTIPTSALNEGANTLSLVSAAGSYPMFDGIELAYKREFDADQNRLSFYTLPNRRAVIGNFSSANIRLFDMMAEHEPVQVTNLNVVNNGGTFAVNFPAHRARLYFAVEDSGLLQVDSIVPNTPSTLSTSSRSGRLVIITHGSFAAEAETWANYRRSQGIAVEVADIADVYDEFSFGMETSRSITDFLIYARNNWQTPPTYVLLLGDASNDPKNYLGFGHENLVPSKIVNTVYNETASDEALGDTNNDGLSEFAIGRIAAESAAEVTQALTKTQAFETPAMQNLNRGAVCAFDEPNGYNFEAVCNELLAELPISVPKVLVNRLTPDSQQTLVNQVNLGRHTIAYAGHGTTGNWHSASFFGQNNFLNVAGHPQVNNPNGLSVFAPFTCLNGYFINPYFDSLAEIAQEYNNGGSVAFWSSSGLTTPDVQRTMGLRFYNQLAAGNLTRLGDLAMDAKSVIPNGQDVRFTWVLLGDPMLKVR